MRVLIQVWLTRDQLRGRQSSDEMSNYTKMTSGILNTTTSNCAVPLCLYSYRQHRPATPV